MIIELNGKQFAFGMHWSGIAETDAKREAQSRAIAVKSPLLWYSENMYLVGLLSEADRNAKYKATIYSGAITLANALGNHPTIFAAFQLNEERFLIVGIDNGKPRKDFDSIKTSRMEVEIAKTQFADSCGEQSILYVGNTDFLGGTPLELDDIVDYADKFAELKKQEIRLPSSIKLLAIAAALAGIGFLAWDQYKAYEAEEIRRKALEAQKAIQAKYDKAIEQRRTQVVLSKDSVSTLLGFVRDWPLDVGGWYLDGFNCKSAIPMQCDVFFTKSKYRLATFQTFKASAGTRFVDVLLDKSGDKISAVIDVKNLKSEAVGVAMDAAKTSDEAINELGSTLQILNNGKMPFISENGSSQLDFADYLLPAGVTRKKLIKPPIRYNTWRIDIPGRELTSLSQLPKYTIIDSIDFKITRKHSFGVQDSFVSVIVKGTAFAKPQ